MPVLQFVAILLAPTSKQEREEEEQEAEPGI
jgi:hypothetical protein